MTKGDKVADAFRCCITEPQCKNCPWKECEDLDYSGRKVEIPVGLALEVNKILQRHTSEEAEMEGGGNTWYFVCGNCHTAIDTRDKYCRECGREIIWQ